MSSGDGYEPIAAHPIISALAGRWGWRKTSATAARRISRFPGRHGQWTGPRPRKGAPVSQRPLLGVSISQSRSIAKERRCRPRAQTCPRDTGRPCPFSFLAFRPCSSSADRRPSSAARTEVPCPVGAPAAEPARHPPEAAARMLAVRRRAASSWACLLSSAWAPARLPRAEAAARMLAARRRRAAPSWACLLSSAWAPARLPRAEAAAEPLPQLEVEEAQLPRLAEVAAEVLPSPQPAEAAVVLTPRPAAEVAIPL
jgi:hypothetical protein